MTHFDVFGLAPSVDLDLRALEQQVRDLSMRFHPDRVAQGDARERRIALEKTTAVNDAFKVLKDPVKRAFYVLKLKGVDLENESSAAQAKMPMAFLEEVMERREKLEGALRRKDVAAAKAMALEVSGLKDAAFATALTALKTDDVNTAAHQLGRVKYFTRFLEEVEAFEEEHLS